MIEVMGGQDAVDVNAVEESAVPATPAIVLGDGDNVAMVTADVRPGSHVQFGDRRLAVRDSIPFGHKIALQPIAVGADIIKFGVPVGRASGAIAPGEHVHIHNVESAYLNNAVDHYDG